jgi:hypothetical protein
MMSSKMPKNYVPRVTQERGGRQNVEGNILISSGNRGKKVFIKIEEEPDDDRSIGRLVSKEVCNKMVFRQKTADTML